MDLTDNFMIIESTGELIFTDLHTVGQTYEFMAFVTDGNDEWDQAWVSADIYGNISPEFDGFIPNEQTPDDPMSDMYDPMYYMIPLPSMSEPSYDYNDNIDNFEFDLPHNFENGIIGTLNADDENEDDVLTWSIDDNSGYFEVNETNGDLTYLGGAPSTTRTFEFYAHVNDNTGTNNATDIAFVTVKRGESIVALDDSGYISDNASQSGEEAAQWYEYQALEGFTLTVGASEGVLVNDSTETSADSFALFIDEQPDFGEVTLQNDGSFSYYFEDVVENDSSPTDHVTFVYYIQDGNGNTSNKATVRINTSQALIERGELFMPWEEVQEVEEAQVGDLIKLRVNVPGQFAAHSFKWALKTGFAVNDYVVDHVVEEVITPTGPQQAVVSTIGYATNYIPGVELRSETQFHWVSGGEHEASVSFQIGNTQFSKDVDFDVHRPSNTNFRAQTSSLFVTRGISGGEVRLGKLIGLPGIYFVYNPFINDNVEDGLEDGEFFMTQLSTIKVDAVRDNDDVVLKFGADGLDYSPRYPNALGEQYKEVLNWDYGWEDSPSSLLPSQYKHVSADYHFTSYLMFRSNQIGSIPVPLERIEWSWGADMVEENFNWSLTPINKRGTLNQLLHGVDTYDFPAWHSLAQNIGPRNDDNE